MNKSDLNKEIWVEIPENEGYYVSNKGRAKCLLNGNVRYLTPTYHKQHNNCFIFVNGKQILLHTLVAKMFIKNPNDYKYVYFKDENPFNCSVENLYWGQHKSTGDIVVKRQVTNILCYSIEGEFVKEFKSISEIKGFLDASNPCPNIQLALDGRLKTAYGYQWRRKNGKIKKKIPAVPVRNVNNPVIMLDKVTGEPKKYFESSLEAAYSLNYYTKETFDKASPLEKHDIYDIACRIRRVCDSKSITACGYKWKYSD